MATPTHYAYNTTGQRIRQQDLVSLLKADWLKQEAGPRGQLFSEYSLTQYLDLEYRLGEKTLTNDQDSLLTKSTGERKKLLLAYQLAQNPDYLILDHPFDGLDLETVKALKAQLHLLAGHTAILQLYTRHEDLLTFCTDTLVFENGAFYKGGKLKPKDPDLKAEAEYQMPQALTASSDVPEVLIEFRDVSVSFGDTCVLQNITWQIKKAETWQLTGANGSGKTTLLSMITGDSVKGYGKELYIFGTKKGSGESVWELKKKIGYVTPVLTERFDGMHSVSDMVVGGIYDSVGLYKRPTSLERSIAAQWIALIGLESKSSSRFRDLSEVNKRLVLIARAMIKNPPLLILDEPTFALGDQDAALVVGLINKLSESTRAAIIYVSHRQEPGLRVDREFRLTKTEKGSVGTLKEG